MIHFWKFFHLQIILACNQIWKILKTVTCPTSPNVSNPMVNLVINSKFTPFLQHEPLAITSGRVDFSSPGNAFDNHNSWQCSFLAKLFSHDGGHWFPFGVLIWTRLTLYVLDTKVPKVQNGTEMALRSCYRHCRFLPKANCVEKKDTVGAKSEGDQVSGKETFFFWPDWHCSPTLFDSLFTSFRIS